MRNSSSFIASHIKSILPHKANEFGCNCRNKESCPLQNKCLTRKEICEAKVTNITEDEKREYSGASNTTFKERYNHTRDFHYERYSKCIECRNTFRS